MLENVHTDFGFLRRFFVFQLGEARTDGQRDGRTKRVMPPIGRPAVDANNNSRLIIDQSINQSIIYYANGRRILSANTDGVQSRRKRMSIALLLYAEVSKTSMPLSAR